MKVKTAKKIGRFVGTTGGIIIVILIAVALLATSWIGTCGVIKLITMCFGWTFKWSWATGIWLIMLLLGGVFGNHTTVKK